MMNYYRRGLHCGSNNCKDLGIPGNWDSTDDCCFDPGVFKVI